MFKKKSTSVEKSNSKAIIEKLDKDMLRNVLGGGDPVPGLDVNLEPHIPGGITASAPSAPSSTSSATATGIKH